MFCGILVGPFMAFDVSNGIMQEPMNWIPRLLIFSLIGFITGYMIDRINKLNAERQERNLKSPFYDIPNVRKLLQDLEYRIKSKDEFKLISIKLTNLQEIEKYIDNKLIFDKLKIDKYFIDRINKVEILELVRQLIEYANTFGKTVTAEGVETEEQLNTLKRLECDEVQGYYYSKHLLPEDFEAFYIDFNNY